jgi:hypothetical protein
MSGYYVASPPVQLALYEALINRFYRTFFVNADNQWLIKI